jgi:hypothetical protein
MKVMDGLVTPFLVAVTERLEEMSGEGLKEVNLGDRFHLIIESFGKIICAFVLEEKDKKEEDLMHLVARKFYKKYYNDVSSPKWDGNVNKFNDFIPEMEEILGLSVEEEVETLPQRPLDTFALIEFEGLNQKLIKLMIRLGEATIKELQSDLKEKTKDNDIELGLEKIIEAGYLGKKIKSDGNRVYFTM